MGQTFLKGLAALLILGPTFSLPAFAAPADIGIITPQGESLDSASAGRIRQDLSDERDRLLVKLKANSPDQKPNSMTTSVMSKWIGARCCWHTCIASSPLCVSNTV